MSERKKRKAEETERYEPNICYDRDPDALDRKIAELEEQEKAAGRWTEKVEESERVWNEKLEKERDRRQKEWDGMTQEEREFDNPMLNEDFAKKVEKWHAEEAKEKAKRLKAEEREAEKARKEELRIIERNRKICEPDAAGLVRIKMWDDLALTTMGRIVSKRTEIIRQLDANRKNQAENAKKEFAPKGSFHWRLWHESKSCKQLVVTFATRIKRFEEELAALDAEYPNAKKWMDTFKVTTKLEQKLKLAQDYDAKNGQDPIVAIPLKKETQEKKDVVMKTESTEKADTKMQTEDEVWTSLEKVFLACFVRDCPHLPERMLASKLYSEYRKWGEACGYTGLLSNVGFPAYTFTGVIKKYDLLVEPVKRMNIIWSMEKAKQLPRAPDFYLGRSTHPNRPGLEEDITGDTPGSNGTPRFQRRWDSIYQKWEEDVADAVVRLPTPKAMDPASKQRQAEEEEKRKKADEVVLVRKQQEEEKQKKVAEDAKKRQSEAKAKPPVRELPYYPMAPEKKEDSDDDSDEDKAPRKWTMMDLWSKPRD